LQTAGPFPGKDAGLTPYWYWVGSTAYALGPWKDFAYKEIKKSLSGITLAICGEVTPCAILTKCGLWGRYGGRNRVCNICLCRLRGLGVVRGVILPYPIDLRYRSYNTGYTTL